MPGILMSISIILYIPRHLCNDVKGGIIDNKYFWEVSICGAFIIEALNSGIEHVEIPLAIASRILRRKKLLIIQVGIVDGLRMYLML
jgi:hypothetical protein